MPDPAAAATAPLHLPPASVDFNALHDALKGGASHAEALDAAVIAETVALTGAEAEARAAESAAVAPSLHGKGAEELAGIATIEQVLHALDRDGKVVPFAEAGSIARQREAIEAKRAGTPILPPTPGDAAAGAE